MATSSRECRPRQVYSSSLNSEDSASSSSEVEQPPSLLERLKAPTATAARLLTIWKRNSKLMQPTQMLTIWKRNSKLMQPTQVLTSLHLSGRRGMPVTFLTEPKPLGKFVYYSCPLQQQNGFSPFCKTPLVNSKTIHYGTTSNVH